MLSDPNLDVARKFGIVYELPKALDEAVKGVGFDIGKYNRMEKSELPLSATYVVSRKGKIVYAFLDPDYKKRAEPEAIVKALQELKKSGKKKY